MSSEPGAFSDGVEATLSSMLDAGLEDATFQALEANLTPGSSGGGGGALPLPGAPSTAAAPFSQPLALSGRGGHGRQLAMFSARTVGARPRAVSAGQDDGGALERCSLLNILILIYYHPRRQCTSDRFLALARLFNRHLFGRLPPAAAAAGVGGAPDASPAHLSVKLVREFAREGWLRVVERDERCWCFALIPAAIRLPLRVCDSSRLSADPLPPPPQATVLLLEMLGVDKPVTALAEGVPLTQDGYAFAGAGVRAQVHAELASWWPAAGPPHAAVLLAWASVLCIVGKAQAAAGDGGAAAAGDWEGHVVAAQEAGAWGALASLARHHSEVRLEPAEMLNNVLLGTLGAVFCAFDFRPAALPLPATTQAVDILVDLFTGRCRVPSSFWRTAAAGEIMFASPLSSLPSCSH